MPDCNGGRVLLFASNGVTGGVTVVTALRFRALYSACRCAFVFMAPIYRSLPGGANTKNSISSFHHFKGLKNTPLRIYEPYKKKAQSQNTVEMVK
jgi:hypothetical protein